MLSAQQVDINGRMLSFDIGWYCWLKKSLKLLAFFKKLVTNFPLTNKGGIKDAAYICLQSSHKISNRYRGIL